MKKFIFSLVMGIVCASSVNAQGIFKKLGKVVTDGVTISVANSTKTIVQIDTLYILNENKAYANIELIMDPADSNVTCHTGNREWNHQFMRATIKKKNDEIQVVRNDDVFIYIYKKDGVTYGKIDTRGL